MIAQFKDKKKKEISPKTSFLELDHYPIHGVIVIVICEIFKSLCYCLCNRKIDHSSQQG